MGSRVLEFWEEALNRKRPAGGEEGGGKRRVLLPLHMHVEHGHREAREQLLWKLNDNNATPAAAARTLCQQFIQQPQQVEKEAARLQKDLELQLDQHRDLATAPPSPSLVKLELRVTLAHITSLFYDEPLWDLGAPRAACERYSAQVCNELGLDWQAHSLITRKLKDAVDAALRDYAAGKALLLKPPHGSAVVRTTPSRMPALVPMTEAQKQYVRDHVEAQRAARRGEHKSEGGASEAPETEMPQSQADGPAAQQQQQLQQQGGVKHEVQAEAQAEVKVEGQEGPAAAAGDCGVKEVLEPGSEQTSGQDMPDLPEPDD